MSVRIIPNTLYFDSVIILLNQGKTVKITVKGNSMNPFLYDHRDEVLLEAPTDVSFKVGDIVLARIPLIEKYVLHRIYKLKGDQVILRGDGNLCGSEACQIRDIVGVAKQGIRHGRAFSLISIPQKIYSFLWRKIIILRFIYQYSKKVFHAFYSKKG